MGLEVNAALGWVIFRVILVRIVGCSSCGVAQI